LFLGCPNRRFSGHVFYLQIGDATESGHQALVNLEESA